MHLSQEIKSILQFMYLGQATFYQDRMNEFLNVAKSLEIKEISKDVESDDVDTFRNQENEEDNSNDIHESSKNQNYVQREVDQTDKQVTGYKDEAGKYQCGKCQKQFSHYRNLWQHNKSAHEGVRYPCNKCKFESTQKVNLV